jgi:hypothetical protein
MLYNLRKGTECSINIKNMTIAQNMAHFFCSIGSYRWLARALKVKLTGRTKQRANSAMVVMLNISLCNEL